MTDFDKRWAAMDARMDNRRRQGAAFMAAIIAVQIALAAGMIWALVALVRMGPDEIAAAAGRAVARFEQARSGQ